MSDTLPSQKSLLFRGMADLVSEIVVAGAVAEAFWQERLRGARELHQAISEIYDRYPV